MGSNEEQQETNAQETTINETAEQESRGSKLTLNDYVRAVFYDKIAFLSILFLLVLAIFAITADYLSPYDPLSQKITGRFQPPMSESVLEEGGFPHVLGTDELGRDIFSRIIYGARASISVGATGALISGFVGIMLGLFAGFYGGLFEDVIMRIVDGMLSLPSLLIALFILFVIGGGFANLILIFTLLRWMIYARMTRGLTLAYRDSTFVTAARAVGCRDRDIIFRHILPNMASSLIVLMVLEVAFLIITESSLSFLGFGIQPPNPSWGIMIARGREYIRHAWWLVTFPGLAIFLTTLSLNLFANWVRTITDPAQRWRWFRTKE